MKLKKLQINSIRGIVNTSFEPGGSNIVIYGPNGSGKSAVVDSIDFLLTGQISRLIGSGTAGITLSKHGGHIAQDDLSQCFVEAVVDLEKSSESVRIRRYLSSPADLEVDEKYRTELESVLDIAKKHEFLLTRREILSFVTADGSSRSEQMQKLLKLDSLGKLRRQLVNLANKFKREKDYEDQQLLGFVNQLNALLQIKSNVDDEQYLMIVNGFRKGLGATALSKLEPGEFLLGLGQPARGQDKNATSLGRSEILNLLTSLRDMVSPETTKEILAKIDAYEQLIEHAKIKLTELQEISVASLLRQGADLISEEANYEEDVCPLCLSNINLNDLRKTLSNRLIKIGASSKMCTDHESNSREIMEFFGKINSVATILKESLDSSIFGAEIEKLSVLVNSLSKVTDQLRGNLIDLLKHGIEAGVVRSALMGFMEEDFGTYESKVKKLMPEGTTRDEKLAELTRLQDKFLQIFSQREKVDKMFILEKRSQKLRDAFETSLKKVMDELYESVKERFVSLYVQLHGEDEKAFEATISQDGGSVDLKVDFHGYGQHPPHALHSEGHQDSMGICLFLALNEKVSEDKLKLIVLDDVVMSVDSQHRRSLCRLLSSQFKDNQFVITTHDTNWAMQMKSLGVVAKKNLIKFYDWKVESGPKSQIHESRWSGIQKNLDENNIPSAASSLRRLLEEYFLDMCVSLRAKVPCKYEPVWTLGDTFPSAWSRYKSLMKRAESAAHASKDKILYGDIQLKLSKLQQMYDRTEAEKWVLNTATHFTRWESLVKEDLQPIVDAFKDLTDNLVCEECGQGMAVLVGPDPDNPGAMSCECSHTRYFLK